MRVCALLRCRGRISVAARAHIAARAPLLLFFVCATTAQTPPQTPPQPLKKTALAGATRELVGYEEGSRRAVTCKGGGFFTGVELAFGPFPNFAEDVVLGLRLRCST